MTSRQAPLPDKPESSSRRQSPEYVASRWIIAGATALCLGLALSLTHAGTLAAWLTILGTLVSARGLHRYGRLGPTS